MLSGCSMLWSFSESIAIFCVGNTLLGRWLGCAENGWSISCQKRTVLYGKRCMLALAIYIPSVWALAIRRERCGEEEFDERFQDHVDLTWYSMHDAAVWTDRQTDWGWEWMGWRVEGWEDSIIVTVLCIHFQPPTAGHLRHLERYSSPKPSAPLDLGMHKGVHSRKDLHVDLMAILSHLSPNLPDVYSVCSLHIISSVTRLSNKYRRGW